MQALLSITACNTLFECGGAKAHVVQVRELVGGIAPLLLLQTDSKYGFAEKSAVG
jgi:hypothetical protein